MDATKLGRLGYASYYKREPSLVLPVRVHQRHIIVMTRCRLRTRNREKLCVFELIGLYPPDPNWFEQIWLTMSTKTVDGLVALCIPPGDGHCLVDMPLDGQQYPGAFTNPQVCTLPIKPPTEARVFTIP